eukprot:268647-Amphidinium_carterae.1
MDVGQQFQDFLPPHRSENQKQPAMCLGCQASNPHQCICLLTTLKSQGPSGKPGHAANIFVRNKGFQVGVMLLHIARDLKFALIMHVSHVHFPVLHANQSSTHCAVPRSTQI